jgi:hypothetical protein
MSVYRYTPLLSRYPRVVTNLDLLWEGFGTCVPCVTCSQPDEAEDMQTALDLVAGLLGGEEVAP